jgi:hypothetical protein
VIVYTNAYKPKHIFVLTGYDSGKGLFTANNPLPPKWVKAKKTGKKKKKVLRCQSGVTEVHGHRLTKHGLLDLLKGGTGVYKGHVACMVK